MRWMARQFLRFDEGDDGMREPVTSCSVRDGRFVEPCDTLRELIDAESPGFSRKRGLFQTTYTNMKTHEPSRSFVGVKCDAYKNGMLFNFCPICGEKIDAPFASDDEPAASTNATDDGAVG